MVRTPGWHAPARSNHPTEIVIGSAGVASLWSYVQTRNRDLYHVYDVNQMKVTV